MDNLKLKKEKLSERCEICHQNDCFDRINNYCSRCGEIEINKQILEDTKYNRKKELIVRITKVCYTIVTSIAIGSFIGVFASLFLGTIVRVIFTSDLIDYYLVDKAIFFIVWLISFSKVRKSISKENNNSAFIKASFDLLVVTLIGSIIWGLIGHFASLELLLWGSLFGSWFGSAMSLEQFRLTKI